MFIHYLLDNSYATKSDVFIHYDLKPIDHNLFLGYRGQFVHQVGKEFQCSSCLRSYKYAKNLRAHQKYQCGKEPQFICDIAGCGYKSKVKGNLKQHFISKHHIQPKPL